jgi:hypothetical protein
MQSYDDVSTDVENDETIIVHTLSSLLGWKRKTNAEEAACGGDVPFYRISARRSKIYSYSVFPSRL